MATTGLAAGTIARYAANLAIERMEILDIGVAGNSGGISDTL